MSRLRRTLRSSPASTRATGLRALVALSAAALSLVACEVVEGPYREPSLREEDVRARAAEVRAQLPREKVHALLGDPWLASERWGFELFRVARKQRSGVFATPLFLPVPIGVVSNELQGYTLVDYDAAGRVEELDSGYTTGPKRTWAMASRPTDDVFLHAGDTQCLMPAEGPEGALVSISLERFLRDRAVAVPAARCLLLMAYRPSKEPTTYVESFLQTSRLNLDDEPRRQLPWYLRTRLRPTRPSTPEEPETSCAERGARPIEDWCLHELIVPLSLAPGVHRLRFTGGVGETGDVQGEVTCTPGELQFAVAVTEREAYRRALLKTYRISGRLEVGAQPPADWSGKRVLVYQRGEWLIGPEAR